MSRRINFNLFLLTLLALFTLGSTAQTPLLKSSGTETDRDRDGLMGPVRRVRTETAKLSTKTGKSVETPHVLLETVAYDVKGAKTENAYYPVPGATLTGKEVYKYDDKGNISEMTLLNTDGSLLSKETYAYDYDFIGNWTKMTTSVAVIANGKLSFEPTEVTYRDISYYLDEATLAKMSQPAAAPSPTPNAAPAQNTPQPVAVTPAPVQKAANVPPPAANSSEKAVAGSPSSITSNTGSSSSPVAKADAEPPAAHPVNVPKPLLKPISGGVLNGAALSLPKPIYSEMAKNARAEGIVAIEVIIDTNGKVISAKAVSGHPLLQQAAIAAAYQARFSPTMLSGQPVKVSGTINYSFALAR